MLTPEQKAAVATMTRITQIIIFALCAGVATYMVVAIFIRDPDASSPLQPIAAITFAVAPISASILLPTIMRSHVRRQIVQSPTVNDVSAEQSDASRLLQSLQVQKIIRAALLEGAAFMNLVVYQLGGPEYLLGVAAALLLGIAMLFPLRRLVEEWLDRELRTIRELRDLRS
jgi:hypothetical protein